MRSPAPRRRHRPWRVLVAASVVAVASTAIPAAASAKRVPPVSTTRLTMAAPGTGFGGYVSFGEVQRISADFVIPTTAPRSRYGGAATWIGAQGPDNRFIQIGVVEYSDGHGFNTYLAFWSDTAQGFHAQPLGAVSGGQDVRVSMRRIHGGWILQLLDSSESLRVNMKVAYAGDASFTLSEWLQEDPAPSLITAVDVPYAQMSAVSFRHVLINDRTPSLTRLDGRVLMANGGEIDAPTRLRNDEFTLVRPRGRALQYLVDARNIDRATALFDAAIAQWPTLTVPMRRAAAIRFALSSDQYARALTTQHWPARVTVVTRAAATVALTLGRALRRWSHGELRLASPQWRTSLAASRRLHRVSDQVRALFDLPPS